MRIENWSKRLADEIEAARGKSFEYGTFDCCIFAFDCVIAITGEDKAAELRGYKSKTEALKIISRYGSLEAMVTALLGEPKHIAFAKRGDVVLSIIDEGEEPGAFGIGICEGIRSWFVSFSGLATRETRQCLKAWSVE